MTFRELYILRCVTFAGLNFTAQHGVAAAALQPPLVPHSGFRVLITCSHGPFIHCGAGRQTCRALRPGGPSSADISSALAPAPYICCTGVVSVASLRTGHK